MDGDINEPNIVPEILSQILNTTTFEDGKTVSTSSAEGVQEENVPRGGLQTNLNPIASLLHTIDNKKPVGKKRIMLKVKLLSESSAACQTEQSASQNEETTTKPKKRRHKSKKRVKIPQKGELLTGVYRIHGKRVKLKKCYVQLSRLELTPLNSMEKQIVRKHPTPRSWGESSKGRRPMDDMMVPSWCVEGIGDLEDDSSGDNEDSDPSYEPGMEPKFCHKRKKKQSELGQKVSKELETGSSDVKTDQKFESVLSAILATCTEVKNVPTVDTVLSTGAQPAAQTNGLTITGPGESWADYVKRVRSAPASQKTAPQKTAHSRLKAKLSQKALQKTLQNHQIANCEDNSNQMFIALHQSFCSLEEQNPILVAILTGAEGKNDNVAAGVGPDHVQPVMLKQTFNNQNVLRNVAFQNKVVDPKPAPSASFSGFPMPSDRNQTTSLSASNTGNGNKFRQIMPKGGIDNMPSHLRKIYLPPVSIPPPPPKRRTPNILTKRLKTSKVVPAFNKIPFVQPTQISISVLQKPLEPNFQLPLDVVIAKDPCSLLQINNVRSVKPEECESLKTPAENLLEFVTKSTENASAQLGSKNQVTKYRRIVPKSSLASELKKDPVLLKKSAESIPCKEITPTVAPKTKNDVSILIKPLNSGGSLLQENDSMIMKTYKNHVSQMQEVLKKHVVARMLDCSELKSEADLTLLSKVDGTALHTEAVQVKNDDSFSNKTMETEAFTRVKDSKPIDGIQNRKSQHNNTKSNFDDSKTFESAEDSLRLLEKLCESNDSNGASELKDLPSDSLLEGDEEAINAETVGDVMAELLSSIKCDKLKTDIVSILCGSNGSSNEYLTLLDSQSFLSMSCRSLEAMRQLDGFTLAQIITVLQYDASLASPEGSHYSKERRSINRDDDVEIISVRNGLDWIPESIDISELPNVLTEEELVRLRSQEVVVTGVKEDVLAQDNEMYDKELQGCVETLARIIFATEKNMQKEIIAVARDEEISAVTSVKNDLSKNIFSEEQPGPEEDIVMQRKFVNIEKSLELNDGSGAQGDEINEELAVQKSKGSSGSDKDVTSSPDRMDGESEDIFSIDEANITYVDSQPSNHQDEATSVGDSAGGPLEQDNELSSTVNEFGLIEVEVNSVRPITKQQSKHESIKCFHCHKVRHSEAALFYHVKNKHLTSLPPWTCFVCNASSFLKRKAMYNHYKRCHFNKLLELPKKVYECDRCATTFVSRSSLLGHSKVHPDKDGLTCKNCQERFSSKCELTVHKRASHPPKGSSVLETCAKVDGSNKPLAVQPPELPHKCSICPKAFRFKRNLTKHNSNEHNACTACGTTFADKTDMKIHMKIVHPSAVENECPISSCHLKFHCRSELNQHLKTHSGAKNKVRFKQKARLGKPSKK